MSKPAVQLAHHHVNTRCRLWDAASEGCLLLFSARRGYLFASILVVQSGVQSAAK